MSVSLDDFARSEPRRGRSTIDRLPAEVQDELLRSSAGHAAAARWLKKVHKAEHVTEKMIRDWRAKKGYRAHDDVA